MSNSPATESSLTWIPCLTIGAHIISRDCLYEILKSALIARLLPLAQRSGHCEQIEMNQKC
jgi:hypothetical protein